MTVGYHEAWSGPLTLTPGRGDFADLYGAVPPPPVSLEVLRHSLPAPGLRRLVLTMDLPGGAFAVDAALWVPEGAGPFPLVAGLDFLGPFGVSRVFPRDPAAIVQAPDGLGVLSDQHGGLTRHRWPVAALQRRGIAVLLSCYGSWVPDCAARWRIRGLVPALGDAVGDAGALSLWAWSMMRLVDVAQQLPEVDHRRIALAGHSRLGKAALWAGARDRRVAAVWANQSGCCGSAPEAHPVGETRAQLVERFPHWLRQPGVRVMACDQHDLLTQIAPRQLYLSNAMSDLWADPLGSYAALVAASAAWGVGDRPDVAKVWQPTRLHRGALGWHLRRGQHEMLPRDWVPFLHHLGWSARP